MSLTDDSYEILKRVEQEGPRRRGPQGKRNKRDQVQDLKDAAYLGASFLPVSGEIISGKEAVEDFRQGNVGMGMLGAAGAIPLIGYGPRIVKGAIKSTGNFGNQVAANMPTLIEGFYSGTPYTSFLRDAIGEIPSALRARTSASERATERVTGIPSAKLSDIENESRVAQRMRNQAAGQQRKGKVAQALGFEQQAKKYNETAEELIRKAKISGQDSEFTAMSIEAGRTPDITPVSERGAFWQSPYKLAYYDAAIPQEDSARIASNIGNAHRKIADIPDDIVAAATNHLVNGPHITTNPLQKKLFEFQIKAPEASRASGVTEGSGAKKGSLIMRSFFNSTAESTTSGFQNYARKIKSLEKRDITPEDTIEYAQLAATLNKDAVKKINLATFGAAEKTDVSGALLLDRISKARANKRAGKEPTPSQQEALSTFEGLIEAGKIDLARITDADGTVVNSLDYNQIKRPNKFIKTATYFASQQKELGGVNQWVAIDPYNQTTYGMISDGHDIFGLNPVGGHSVITAQPIMKQKWSDVGYADQHVSNVSRKKVSDSVKEVEKRTGLKAPKDIREATDDKYYSKAKDWTRAAMRKKQEPTVKEKAQARASKQKLTGAVAVSGSIGAGTASGMLTGNNQNKE